jgi:signal transduction histidine kinase
MVVFVLVVFGISSVYFSSNLLKTEIMKHLEDESNSRGMALRILHDMRLKQLYSFTQTEKLQKFIINSSLNQTKEPDSHAREKMESGKAIAEFFNYAEGNNDNIFKNVKGMFDLKIVDKNGIVILASNPREEGLDLSTEPLFKKGLERAFVTYGTNNYEGSRAMIAVSPITQINDEGKTWGVAISNWDTVVTDMILLNREKLGKTGETYMVDENHVMLSPSRFINDASFNIMSDTFPVRSCFEKKESYSGTYNDYRGIEIVGSSYCASDSDFVLLTEIDADEVFLPLRDMINTIFILGSATVALFVLVSIPLSNRLIKPLHMLKEYSMKISDGDLSTKFETTKDTAVEIRNVSNTLNIMTDNLRKARVNVQQQNEIIKEQMNDLKQADVEKEQFLAIITHELKTPLFPIQGYCEMLKEQKKLDVEQENMIDEIYKNSKILEKLIQDLLLAQKIQMEKITYVKEDFSIQEFLDKIKLDFSSIIKEKQIQLVISLDIDFRIISDSEKLYEIFTNLVTNAIDFVPKSTGLIEIGAKKNSNHILFFVKDNGIGISKEHQKKLFTNFYQVDTSMKRKHGGNGLGLSICKGIVSGFGGKIWVESEEGKGATFYFILPKNLDESLQGHILG